MAGFAPGTPPGVRVAFTSVSEGNLALHVGDDPAAVQANRRRLEESLGLPQGGLRFMDQVHSALVHDVPPGPRLPGPSPTADAMVSVDGAAPLAVMVADCLPVVFVASTEAGAATAVAHAGRKGLLDGVLEATVARLAESGARSIQAWIGPAICGDCYEVPHAMAAAAESVLPGIAVRTSWGTPSLDLPGAARRLLLDAGVDVVSTGVCTLESPDHYSYRRDARTGRFAGLVWTEPAARG